jgi:CheY-like chemotaxis protein
MMKMGFKTDSEREQAVDSILVSGKSLLRLVDHVLDFSKLESGDMEIVPAPTEVSKLIGDVVGAFRSSNKNSSLEIRYKVNALPALMVDPQRIGQMLFDLVGNAVKFTTSGFIEVRATFTLGGARPVATDGEVSGTLRIDVEDSGCGIGAEDLKRIMSPYEQVTAKEARHGGTGLGLAFCRQLANAMGGDITVTSALGKGSTFTITLPGVKAAEKPEIPGFPEIPGKPESVTHRRILIVDDQKMNLVVLKAMLKKLGDFDVAMAADGKQALAALEAPDAQPFDMVLTDMWMPELDGEGLVKAIRASEKLKTLPVHVVTADVELAKRHVEVGFTSILLKPITVEKIRPVVCDDGSGKDGAP